MKRALIPGIGAVLFLAAVGLGREQTHATSDSRPVFGDFLGLLVRILPPERYQNSIGQDATSSSRKDTIDSAIACDPPGSTADHGDIKLNWLGFGDAGAISANTSGGVDF
ncbi:MAG TPA: hypothetical protein PK967_12390 [Candidatus Hydrogenedentes bacterium]|nr:hypothetical protein [Candidatus Hydrogenedentota bacterium]